MKIILYTLPTCSICNMVKTKLNQKNLLFEERDFRKITTKINSEYAPALEIINDEKSIIYNNPSQIVNWINQQ